MPNKKVFSSSKYKYIFLVFALMLFLVPFIFWQVPGKANIGGDDSRLYMYFPGEWMRNISLWSFISFTGLSIYNPQHFYFPFSALATGIKLIVGQNLLQPTIFGLILSGAFLSVYGFIHELISIHRKDYIAINLSALLYLLLPISYLTFWHEPFKFIFGLAIYPLLAYLFLKSIRSGKIVYILVASLITGLFSISTSSIPFVYPYLIGMGVFFTLYFFIVETNKFRFIKLTIIFGVLSLLINLFWIVPMVNSAIIGADQIQSATSTETIQDSISGIMVRTEKLNVADTLLGLHSRLFVESSRLWFPIDSIASYIYSFTFLNIIFPFIIGIGLYTANNKGKYKKLLIISVIPFLLFTYLQTVSIGDWGVYLFAFLTEFVPGFVSIRNFQNKVTITYLLLYSTLFALTLTILAHKITNYKIKKLIYFSVFIVIVIQSLPFIKGDVNKIPLAPNSEINHLFSMPAYYSETISTLSHQENVGRITSLPLSIGTWAMIVNDDYKGLYQGASIIKAVLGIQEFNGRSSFKNPYMNDLPDRMATMLLEMHTESLKILLGYLGNTHILFSDNMYDDRVDSNVREKYLWLYGDGVNNKYYEEFTQSLNLIKSNKDMNIYSLGEKYSKPQIYAANREIFINDLNHLDLIVNHTNSIINLNHNEFFSKKKEGIASRSLIFSTKCVECVPQDGEIVVLPEINIFPSSKIYFLLEMRNKKTINTDANTAEKVNYYLGTANKKIAEIKGMIERNDDENIILKSAQSLYQTYEALKNVVSNIDTISQENNQILKSVDQYSIFHDQTILQVMNDHKLPINTKKELEKSRIAILNVKVVSKNKKWVSTSNLLRYLVEMKAGGIYDLVIKNGDGIDVNNIELSVNGDVVMDSNVSMSQNRILLSGVKLIEGQNRIEFNITPKLFEEIQPITLSNKEQIYKKNIDRNSSYQVEVELIAQKEPKSVHYKIMDDAFNNRVFNTSKLIITQDHISSSSFTNGLSTDNIQVKFFEGIDTVNAVKIRKISNPTLIVMSNDVETQSLLPEVKYDKVNPSHWNVEVSKTESNYVLVYLDSYNPGWKMVKHDDAYEDTDLGVSLLKSIQSSKETKLTNEHILVNGYANGWIMNESSNAANFALVFEPQRIFYRMLIISLVTGSIMSIIILKLILWNFIKRKHD